MAEIVQCVDATLGFYGCVLTADPDFLLEGNDYDEVDAQMQMADSDPSHFEVEGHRHHDENVPAHDSGSVPPGLNGHHDPSHDQQHSLLDGDQGGADTSAPLALPEDKDNEPMAPPESDSDTSIPLPDSAPVPEPTISVIEPVSQLTTDADGRSSTQTEQQANGAPAGRTLSRSPSTATVPDVEAQAMEPQDTVSATQAAEDDLASADLDMERTQILEPQSDLPQPEQSSSSQTSPTLKGSSLTTVANEGQLPQVKLEVESSRVPSANRLSISYAAGTRRMVIDAAVVEKLKVYRSEARIEVYMSISEDNGRLKGILVCLSFVIVDNDTNTPIRLREQLRARHHTRRLRSRRMLAMIRLSHRSGKHRSRCRPYLLPTSRRSVLCQNPDGSRPATSTIG
jgi:20S proteasome subunit alpha 6